LVSVVATFGLAMSCDGLLRAAFSSVRVGPFPKTCDSTQWPFFTNQYQDCHVVVSKNNHGLKIVTESGIHLRRPMI
jgi:hypothetical protein